MLLPSGVDSGVSVVVATAAAAAVVAAGSRSVVCAAMEFVPLLITLPDLYVLFLAALAVVKVDVPVTGS